MYAVIHKTEIMLYIRVKIFVILHFYLYYKQWMLLANYILLSVYSPFSDVVGTNGIASYNIYFYISLLIVFCKTSTNHSTRSIILSHSSVEGIHHNKWNHYHHQSIYPLYGYTSNYCKFIVGIHVISWFICILALNKILLVNVIILCTVTIPYLPPPPD